MSALGQKIRLANPSGFANRARRLSPPLHRTSQQSGLVANPAAHFATASLSLSRHKVHELDRVRLLAAVRTDGGLLPSGSTGTAVYRYRNGEAFEVEFVVPFHTLLTLRASEVERAGD